MFPWSPHPTGSTSPQKNSFSSPFTFFSLSLLPGLNPSFLSAKPECGSCRAGGEEGGEDGDEEVDAQDGGVSCCC